jgi:hypothetical protein
MNSEELSDVVQFTQFTQFTQFKPAEFAALPQIFGKDCRATVFEENSSEDRDIFHVLDVGGEIWCY